MRPEGYVIVVGLREEVVSCRGLWCSEDSIGRLGSSECSLVWLGPKWLGQEGGNFVSQEKGYRLVLEGRGKTWKGFLAGQRQVGCCILEPWSRRGYRCHRTARGPKVRDVSLNQQHPFLSLPQQPVSQLSTDFKSHVPQTIGLRTKPL